MANQQDILNRLEEIDSMCANLRCRAMGFDLLVDDFLRKPALGTDENGEMTLNLNYVLEFAIELAKGGYAILPIYNHDMELLMRYSTITNAILMYLNYSDECCTFTTLDYLFELYDKDYETFSEMVVNSNCDFLLRYFAKLENLNELFCSEILALYELLAIHYIDKYVPDNILNDISTTVMNDVNEYLSNNPYDVLLLDDIANIDTSVLQSIPPLVVSKEKKENDTPKRGQ